LSTRTEEPANVPTYQYACIDPACDHRFEQFQSFTDPALTVCPVCSGQLRKVYGSVGVVFKGSGFYRNDSRAESNGVKHKSRDAESSSASDSSSKSLDKSAAKEGSTTSGSDSSTSAASSKTPTKAGAKSGSSTSSSGTSKD